MLFRFSDIIQRSANAPLIGAVEKLCCRRIGFKLKLWHAHLPSIYVLLVNFVKSYIIASLTPSSVFLLNLS